MRIDRWVLAPSVSAALSLLAAVAPPVGDADDLRGLRVESRDPPRRGAPLLLRATLDDARAERLLPLGDGAVEVTSGGRVDRAPLRRSGRSPWSVANLPALGGTRAVVRVTVDGRRVAWRGDLHDPRYVGEEPDEPDGPSLRVAEGALLPGVAGTLLVRAPRARSVEFSGGLDNVEVSPARVDVDLCGVALARVVAHALGAPITVTVNYDAAPSRAWRPLLPVRPGGAVAVKRGGGYFARTAAADGPVWFVLGSPHGPSRWGVVDTAADGDLGVAAIEAPRGASWVELSRASDLSDPVIVGLEGRSAQGCDATPAGRQWSGTRPPRLSPTAPFRLIDGRVMADRSLARRRRFVRHVALASMGVSMVAVAVMVLSGAFSREHPSLRTLETRGRARWARVGAALAVVAVVGLALAVVAAVVGDVGVDVGR